MFTSFVIVVLLLAAVALIATGHYIHRTNVKESMNNDDGQTGDPDSQTVRHRPINVEPRNQFTDGLLFASVLNALASLKEKGGVNKLFWIDNNSILGEHKDMLCGAAVLDLRSQDVHVNLPDPKETTFIASIHDLFHHVSYLNPGTTNKIVGKDLDTSVAVLIIRIGKRSGQSTSAIKNNCRLKARASNLSIPRFASEESEPEKLRHAAEWVEKHTNNRTQLNMQRIYNAKSINTDQSENMVYIQEYKSHFTQTSPTALHNTPGFTEPVNHTKAGIALFWMFVPDNTKAFFFTGSLEPGAKYLFQHLPTDLYNKQNGFCSLTICSLSFNDNKTPQAHYSSVSGMKDGDLAVGPYRNKMCYGIRVYMPDTSSLIGFNSLPTTVRKV